MLIAQISDTHITSPGSKAYGVASMAENLRTCVEHINQMVPRPDVVIHSGDVTNAGTVDECRYAAEILAGLDMPLYVVPGNHDAGKNLSTAFEGGVCPDNDYVVEDYRVRLIGMDSTRPGQPGGLITVAQARWLDERLAAQPDKPTMIFLHHPPVKCSVLESDEDGFEGSELLGAVVEKYANVERILCGHIHLLVQVRWHGTLVSTAPSIGMQLGLDLTMQKPSEFLLSAPGYLLHYQTNHGHLVTHVVSLAGTKGPYFFKEHG